MILKTFIYYALYPTLVLLFASYLNVSYLFHYYFDYLFCDFKNHSTYDYIVVGAGSAGSVVASRLINLQENVLLLEAGNYPLPLFNIPLITPLLQRTVYDWQYKTIPQKDACKGLENNQSVWVSGKVLGGSSRLNYMAYVRGHPEDYSSWFPEYEEPLVENNGPLYAEEARWHSEVSEAILKGIEELSYPLKNINKRNNTGFMRTHYTSRNGERWSNDQLLNGHNDLLKIIANAYVYKILFHLNKAVGVEFFRHSKIYKAFARKGVIVSCGAVGSAKLLMLSGIGPKKHLEDFNINVVADLPVGKNLMDHLTTIVDITLNTTASFTVEDAVNPWSMINYFLFGKGPWTSSGIEIVGTFHSKLQKNKADAPDLQIMVMSAGLSQDNGVVLRKNVGISRQIFNTFYAPLAYKNSITILPVLLHPKSLGEIRLKTGDYNDAPHIDPKYLTNEDDILTLIEGINFMKSLVATNAVKKFGMKFYSNPFPGCDSFNFNTFEYWKCYVKHLSFSIYHPAGTCRIGDVVDSNFSIYQTKNLFVVDASVLPFLPSGNINAAITMLAEKASNVFCKIKKNFLKSLKECYKSDLFLNNNKCF